MANWRGYEHLLMVEGKTEQERAVNHLKEAFLDSVAENPGYESHARRNGIEQPMLFTRSDVQYKANVTVLPGDELFPGDIIEAYGERWICVETRVMNTIQKTGLIWLCNYEFKWQNFSPEICSAYGVLDSGVYSTTKNGDEQLQYLDKQFKVYLPFNEDTEKIFVDKRIATGYAYDAHGEQIMTVYSVTGVDYTSRSYGKGAHLLILNLRSSAYNASTDNLEYGVCDYIEQEPIFPCAKKLDCNIKGRGYLRMGGKCTLKPEFLDEYDSPIEGIEPLWTVVGDVPNGITLEDDGDNIVLKASKQTYVGSSVVVTLTDTNNRYNIAYKEVEVRAYG